LQLLLLSLKLSRMVPAWQRLWKLGTPIANLLRLSRLASCGAAARDTPLQLVPLALTQHASPGVLNFLL
jgi:hypothetical protein